MCILIGCTVWVQKLNILILKFMSIIVALKAEKRIAQGKA